MGTVAESIDILIGWSIPNVRYWYIVGALLGGFPLAQGSVYLLMKKRFADISSVFFVSLIIVSSVFVILTPITIPDNFDYKLTGKVFEWKWVRYFSPLINLYAFFIVTGKQIGRAHV